MIALLLLGVALLTTPASAGTGERVQAFQQQKYRLALTELLPLT